MIRTLEETLHSVLGIDARRVTPLHGGCIGDVYRVDLAPGNPLDVGTVVVKQDTGSHAVLALEGYMLAYLREHAPDVPVPEVFYASDNLLVMSFLPGDSRFSPKAQAHAASLFARLHQVKAPQFGLERDTLIGGLHQPNPWTDTWVGFFREHRIWHMATLAHREGQLPQSMLARLERFCSRLDEWLEEPQHPALLHGDAWTTNILAEGDCITGLLDPAIYYGHPEIELAFTTLFGTFGEPFFKRYNELHPIQPGFFELRRDLYNVYPLLVHVRLFGRSYLSSIDRTLNRIGC